MTICLFSTQYLPTMGGVERYTYNLARQLVSLGHKVIVVTSALPGLAAQQEQDGISIYRLPSWLAMNGRFPLVFPGFSTHRMVKEILEQKPGFCVIQARFYPLSLFAAHLCHKHHLPAILLDHSTGHMPMGDGLVGKVAHWYEHMAARYLKKCGLDFYGVSGDVCHWLSHFGIAAKGTLFNAVFPEEIQQQAYSPTACNWRDKLGVAPNTKLVVFAGRLIAEKGVFLLADAFTQAAPQNAALVIAGEGPLLNQIQQLNNPAIHCVGPLEHPKLLQLLAQANLYCLPTYYAEGFPTTFLEAAACDCPILTSCTGGSGELLPSPEYGIRLAQLDVPHLAQQLSWCLANEEWQHTAKTNTKHRLLEQFTWNRVADTLLRLAHSYHE